MNETVISFCGYLKFSIISVKLNILFLGKGIDEIINNSRAKAVFISSGLLSSFENSVKKNVNILNA